MIDRDDRHFHKYPHLRSDASAYVMNDAMNAHDHAYGCDANDGRMSVLNVANVADALGSDFAADVYTFHIRNDFHLPTAVYI